MSCTSSCHASHHFAPILEEMEKCLKKLEVQFEKMEIIRYSFVEKLDYSMFKALRDHIQTLLVDFNFWIMFHDMVGKLSSGLWIELRSSLHKVVATINDIGKELMISHRTNKVSKLILTFSSLMKKIEVLQPEIEKPCNYLFEVEHKDRCWVHYGHWDGFTFTFV